MTELIIGDQAPDFTAPADGNNEISLSGFRGKKIVLYFYPKDDTPGCTTEACAFRDSLETLAALGAVVIGVSKDSVAKHDRFKDKYSLNFPLVADESGEICEKYGVWVEKSLYGRKYMGIERATFLIDESGKIRDIWRPVKVKDHVKEVRAALENLSQAA